MKNKINYFRRSKNMTQEELAGKANITRPYLSEIENNSANPGIEICLSIARALKVSVEELFFTDIVNNSELKTD